MATAMNWGTHFAARSNGCPSPYARSVMVPSNDATFGGEYDGMWPGPYYGPYFGVRGGAGMGADPGSGGRATRNSVMDVFQKTQTQFEGFVDVMYTDVIGLVTTGMGNLIDDKSGINGYGPALQYAWIRKSDGQPATQAEIIQDWQTVKNAHTASGTFDLPNDRKITQLKLPPLVIQDMIASRFANNEKELLKSFPGFASFPADGQMAIHGMAWAMGSAFVPVLGFHMFADAVNRGDWLAAKAQSAFQKEAKERKAGHDKMFDNAAKAVANKLDFGTLWYPGDAPATPPTGVMTVTNWLSKNKTTILVAGGVIVGGIVLLQYMPLILKAGKGVAALAA